MKCLNCGAELPEEAKFCFSCGAKITQNDVDCVCQLESA